LTPNKIDRPVFDKRKMPRDRPSNDCTGWFARNRPVFHIAPIGAKMCSAVGSLRKVGNIMALTIHTDPILLDLPIPA
jgi:hypothetical protein